MRGNALVTGYRLMRGNARGISLVTGFSDNARYLPGNQIQQNRALN